jgi:signal transduction histidine kinase/sugar lactone lactonase YvrE
MKTAIGLIAAWLCAFAALAADEPSQTPLFQRFGVAEGLPSGHVNAIAGDAAGHVWIATADGLARYDGLGFEVHRYAEGDPRSLPGNNVQAVLVDRRGWVWAAIESQGVSVMRPGSDGFVTLRRSNLRGLRSDEVWSLAETRDGSVWIGTYDGGLHRFDPRGRVSHYGMGEGLPSDTVVSLAADARGGLWIGTAKGVAHWSEAGLRGMPPPDEFALGEVAIGLHADAEGVWVGSSAGAAHLDFEGSWSRPAGLEAVASVAVPQLQRDTEGDLWLGTPRGLFRRREGRLVAIRTDGEAEPRLMAGYLDHDGGLWWGTLQQGLLHLPMGWRRFAVYRAESSPGLSPQVVSAAAQAGDGRLWLVGDRGRLDALDPASSAAEDQGLQWASPRLYSLLATGDGAVWIGHQQGLTHWNPASGERSELDAGANDAADWRQPTSGLVECHGEVWALTPGVGLRAYARDGSRRFLLREGPALPTSDLEQIGCGPDGSLWAVGLGGIYRLDAASRRMRNLAEHGTQRVFGLFVQPPDTLWTHRLGGVEAWRWQGGRLQRIRAVGGDAGLPALESGGLVMGADGRFWLPTQRGLLRVDPVTGQWRLFGLRDGLPSQEFALRPPLLMDDGRIVAGNFGGLVLFDPRRFAPPARALPLRWESLRWRREEDEMSAPASTPVLRLEHGDRDLRVQARLASLADPRAHRYRFRLRGFDPDWVEVGSEGVRSFSQLQAGSYLLEAIGTDADGLWSAPARLELRIAPPWWRSPWAYVAYVLAGLLAAWAMGRAYRARIRARHAQQLSEARRRLAEEHSQAKSRFLADLGHEIRTPLAGVLGMAELLDRDGLPAPQQARVEAIRRAGGHLLRLVNDALDMARIESGKLSLDDQPFDPRELLVEVEVLLREQALAKRLAWDMQVAPDLPRALRGDAARLRQVLLNLGGNAIKFTGQGRVWLRVGALRPQGLRIEVGDSGPGMSQEQCARLFRRFEQAEGQATARRYGGSGLGLAICHELCGAMGGSIRVESREGEGSVFTVELPLPASEVMPAVAGVPSAPARAGGAGLHLLLVEDDELVAEVVRELLQGLGHRVDHAPQALAALAELSLHRYDLAILDLDLPGMDGLQLAALLRAQGQALPLLALTARSDGEAEAQARAAGMRGFLRKPVDAARLDAAIAAAMAAGR